jgi:hypothetical protein
MLATAAEMASYIYPDTEDPAGAFSWWLSPCGGTDLVPDGIKKVFEILSFIPDGVSSFKPPKIIPKGSGRKGDSGNPEDQSTPRAPGTIGGGSSKPKCKVPPSKQMQRFGAAKNTVRVMDCVRDKTRTIDYIVTSIFSAQGATPSQVSRRCAAAYGQACYHYSSAIRNNPKWATLTCPPEAAATSKIRVDDSPALGTWLAEHKGDGWKDKAVQCDRDEFPPAYFLSNQVMEWTWVGEDGHAQLVRYLPSKENQDAGRQIWKSLCFKKPLLDLTDRVIRDKVLADPGALTSTNIAVVNQKTTRTETYAAISVDKWPEFTITAWDRAANWPADDGLWDNPC